MQQLTIKGNAEDELFLVLWCDTDGVDERIHTHMSYFCSGQATAYYSSGSSGKPMEWSGMTRYQSH